MLDRASDTDRVVQIHEARSRALHRAIGERLVQDPTLVRAARERVRQWLAEGRLNRVYAQQWLALLEGPLDDLVRALDDPGEQATTLRSCSPFAGVLDPRTRFRIWREAGQQE
jgi:hypothetical protein